MLHYGYTAIANYESGRNEPSIRDLIRLADYFQVSVDYLIGRSDLKQRVGGLKLVKRRVTRADLYKKYEKISLAQVLLWADAQTKKDGP